MGPEFFGKKNEKRTGFSGKLADIWALGVTIYCFIFLELPFHHENPLSLADKIRKQK
jgi:[calcium/calmodulin-dependent protein kinase] kinase